MQIFADDRGTFTTFLHFLSLVVLSQFGIPQYNSLNVQSWPEFQREDSLRENDLDS